MIDATSGTSAHQPRPAEAVPPRPIDASPSNLETKSRSDATTLAHSDSEGDTTLNQPRPPVPVEETNYRMSASKPASYAKQKLQSGGYGYHSSPYVSQTPGPPAKRQAVARKIPRRPLPRIPDKGGSTILTPFGGMPRKGVREHTVSLRLEHVQKTLRPLLLKFMQVIHHTPYARTLCPHPPPHGMPAIRGARPDDERDLLMDHEPARSLRTERHGCA